MDKKNIKLIKIFVSNKKFSDNFSGNLVIFCSDERFIKATLEFLHRCLRVKNYDLMAVPGGPVFIINKEKCLVDRLKLLVDKHNISNIIIFSHSDCGYYKQCHKDLNSNLLSKRQIEDIRKIKLQLEKLFPDVMVKSFYVIVNKRKFLFQFIN